MIYVYAFVIILVLCLYLAGLEFAYFEAQDSLKGFVMGLYILMSGVGSYILAKILVSIVNAASNGKCFEKVFKDSVSKWYNVY